MNTETTSSSDTGLAEVVTMVATGDTEAASNASSVLASVSPFVDAVQAKPDELSADATALVALGLLELDAQGNLTQAAQDRLDLLVDSVGQVIEYRVDYFSNPDASLREFREQALRAEIDCQNYPDLETCQKAQDDFVASNEALLNDLTTAIPSPK